jgi:hypothetical protein
MAEYPLKYRQLFRILKRYGVWEDRRRGRGSERMLCREVGGRVERSPIRCHNEGEDKPKGVVASVRRRLKLTESDGVSDREFYG